MHNPIRFTALLLLLAMTGVACDDAPSAATTLPSTDMSTTTSSATSTTTATLPSISDLPSQSPADADRDGVVPELAELPISVRFLPLIRPVESEVGYWSIGSPTQELIAMSRQDDCLFGDVDGHYPTEVICTTEYGELLLFNDEVLIDRAFPMPSATPSWLLTTETHTYVGHIGDGGNPDSVIGRIDHADLESTFLVFGGQGQDWLPTWELVDPSLYRGIVEASPVWEEPPEGYVYADSWIGAIWIDVERLEAAFAAAEAAGRPATGGLVVYGDDGVVVVDDVGSTRKVTTTPAAFAVAVDDLVLVQQPDELRDPSVYPPWRGWLVDVYRSEPEPSVIAVSNAQLQLWDARMIDGKPVALMTLIKWQDDETYEELLLVDLEPEPSDDPGAMFTSLGRVGSYENLVVDAQFGGDLIILSTPESGIEARTLTGEVVWTGVHDRHESPFVVAGSELWVLTPWFDEPNFDPMLDIQRRDLATGEELVSSTTVNLEAKFDGGFCLRVDWTGEHLLCDETYGPPFVLDIETGEVIEVVDLIGRGAMTAASSGS